MPKGGNRNGNGGNGNGGNGGGGGSQDPKIVDQAFTTLENPLDGTSLGFVTADVNPKKATWSIVSGNDDGAYYIDPVTGELFIGDGDAVDFEDEQIRDLIVQVTENGNKVHSATVTVNVTDVNEAPAVEAATFSVAEDETAIGTVPASDPEDDALSYAIIGGDPDALFEFDLDGNLIVADGKSLDYETTQQHVLQVEVTDTGGLSDAAEVTINVTDVDEAPEIITSALSADENQRDIGFIEASDPENEALAFALTGNGPDDDKFIIDPVSGALSFTTSPDFERPTDADGNGLYQVDVRVDDEAGNSSTREVTVAVQDVEGEFATDVVSTNAAGNVGNGRSWSASVSADGRYVAFDSDADNLVPGDTNGLRDIFVKDTWTGAITRASTTSDGTQSSGTGGGGSPSLSASGRYVAFLSKADNLVDGDNNDSPDIFLKDLETGAVTAVSTSSDGTFGNGQSYDASISADGRYVAFRSHADNLVVGDRDAGGDIFLKDTVTGQISLVSQTSDGVQANGSSFATAISADGRYVAFNSSADNLVEGDDNGTGDVFVKDVLTGEISIASTTDEGVLGNGPSYIDAVSADGRYVAIVSNADNLVAGDTNGVSDVFVKDMETGAIVRASTTSDGAEVNDHSGGASISADGRYVAFASFSNDLVPDDTNEGGDIFVKDLFSGAITRVSTASDGGELDGIVRSPSISGDGNTVVFLSDDDNLVLNDTNNVIDVFASSNFYPASSDDALNRDPTQETADILPVPDGFDLM